MTPRHRSITACWLAVLLLALVLAGSGACSSPRVVSKPSGVDQDLDRFNKAARTAFENGKFKQAADLYRRALERAYVRDDLNAGVDAQYNLAVCLIAVESYEEGLEWIHQAQANLATANRAVSVDILLLEAIILYRIGQETDAWKISDQVLFSGDRPSAAVQSKTHYLRGLIADGRGDINQLRQEIQALGKPATAGLQADQAELVGRLAMAERNWDAAADAFDTAVDLRRRDLDYREMANALGLAAQAWEQAGDPLKASARYLRAGRSAALQGQNHNAGRWLTRAEALAAESGAEFIAREARRCLTTLPQTLNDR